MEKKSKNNHVVYVLVLFLIISSASFTIQAHSNSSVTLSFDHIFPVSYYQKGIEYLLSVWHILMDAHDKDVQISFDGVLSKLALAQYAINRMIQDGNLVVPEDIEYLKVVVSKIQSLVGVIIVTPETHDLIDCINDMVLSIANRIGR